MVKSKLKILSADEDVKQVELEYIVIGDCKIILLEKSLSVAYKVKHSKECI